MSENLFFSIICILFGGAEWKNFTEQFEITNAFNKLDLRFLSVVIIANNKLLLSIPKDLLSAPCWALCWSPGI